MSAPLVFTCPNIGIAVMRSLELGNLSRAHAMQIMCEVECPCGERHEFRLSDAYFFDRYFERRSAVKRAW